MVDTDGGGGSPPPEGRKHRQASQRNPRLRLACLRCQRRKIRCGGEIPACKNCTNAGAVCTDGESARLRDLPRAYIVNLKSRIEWLESVVRARCPDVDLSRGPQADDRESPGSLAAADESLQSIETGLSGPTVEGSETPTRSQQRIGPGPPFGGGGSDLSHEIGLVSLGTNQDPRYIGPSSGYFLARVMLTKPSVMDERMPPPMRDLAFPSELVEAVQGPLPLPSREMAKQLCEAYFDVIHPQYPILHQPTFLRMVDQAYNYDHDISDPVVAFQVNMVFAMGATILSARLKARIPGESYCLSAMQHFHRLNVENSLQGLQCLLLLLLFTIHNPYVRLNVWYLNYQCIAALLDLGLQRDISGISLLEQEMRVRIFWVVFMLDRIIATMMGRPIGLRDEACELRLPQGLHDSDLSGNNRQNISLPSEISSPMSYSVHLFRLAKLNSEIKYVANSIVREAPAYAYPAVRDIHVWQTGMLQQLDQWASQIPPNDSSMPGTNMHLTCQLRYHSLRMLLLRPSPAIPKPSVEALMFCHESARQSIRIFDQLYKKNLLIHSWMTFHSLVLSIITMLYCIKIVPDIARRTELDILMADLSVGLSVLSATGEHWSGAKRSRDILDELGRAIIRWLHETMSGRRADPQANRNAMSIDQLSGTPQGGGTPVVPMDPASIPYLTGDASMPPGTGAPGLVLNPQNPFDDLMINNSFAEYFDATPDSVNVDNIVRELFQGFIPIYQNFN